MKKSILYLLVVFLVICGCNESSIKSQALRSSTQIATYMPGIRVFFISPLKKDEPFDKDVAEKMLDARIAEVRESIRKEVLAELDREKEDKHESSITAIETWIEDPKSKTEIPIGALKGVPKYAEFLKRVIVVYKTESAEIKPWDKAAEKDVLAISETAGVSISKAKEMLEKIRAEGYTVSKESVKEDSEVSLLWYHSGWDTYSPTALKWSVIVEGTSTNLLCGYDDRGILKTKPIPDKKRVFVSTGYFDLKDKFKPKSSTVEGLEKEVDRLEKLKKGIEKERDDLKKKVDAKDLEERTKWARDITTATMADVMYGIVGLELFWTESIGTGLYLGDAKLSKAIDGSSNRYHGSFYGSEGTDYGLILTNAHVANDSIAQTMYVSEDKEVMYIVGPGYPFIRYTDESDSIGSPAWLLASEHVPVMSTTYDCAIMVTQKVAGFNRNRIELGDSARVKQGDRICFAGNPSGYQKILSVGQVTKTGYSFLDSKWGEMYFKWGGKTIGVEKIWHDAVNSHGGTSGSGLFAMSGKESGKVIGLHHAGLRTAVTVSEARIEKSIPRASIAVDDIILNSGWDGLVKDITPEQKTKLFANFPFQEAKFQTVPLMELKDKPMVDMLTSKYRYALVPMVGMSCAIPINPIKQYLQERGLDPAQFGFEGMTKEKQEG